MKHDLKESGNRWHLIDILVGFVGLQTSLTLGSLGPRINKSKAAQFEDVTPFPGLGHDDHDGMRLKQELLCPQALQVLLETSLQSRVEDIAKTAAKCSNKKC